MGRLIQVALLAPLIALTQDDPGPQPPIVDPGDETRPPSDAIVLFNGKDMTGWVTANGSQARCDVADEVMSCTSGVGDILTLRKFQSGQLHLEFAVPHMPDQRGQLRGNSGVYLHAKYEIQVLDSFDNPTYGHGSLGGLYGQAPPLVNAARPPEQWQSYDMIFRAPKCDASGKVTEKAIITVLLNGVLIHDHVPIDASEKLGQGCEPGPLMLQDHSGFPNAPVTTMRFRKLWYRPLD
jgi:hypothetical protein